MLFWSGWGSYKYLCAVRNKEPVLLPYIKILGAIGLLVLIWVIARDVPIAARVMVTPVALAMFYEAYVLIKNHHSFDKKPSFLERVQKSPRLSHGLKHKRDGFSTCYNSFSIGIQNHCKYFP